MGNDKHGMDDAYSEEFVPAEERGSGARSVTDLIDSIERTAFKRYLSDRKARAHMQWSTAPRAEM